MLRWEAVHGAGEYLVEICRDRSCGQIIDSQTTRLTQSSPRSRLDRGAAFWRVTAIAATARRESYVWEFFVGGRSAPRDTSSVHRFDLNGDGVCDVASGRLENDRVVVFMSGDGGLPGLPTAELEIDTSTMAAAGDVNGDGFGDLVVGGGRDGGAGAHLFFGGRMGLDPAPTVLPRPVAPPMAWAYHVAGLGDVDGDGYAEVAVCWASIAVSCHLYRGGPGDGLTPPGSGFEASEAFAAGDVNGDGYADVVFGLGMKSFSVALGGKTGLGTVKPIVVPQNVAVVHSVASAGDLNGDGLSEVVMAGRAAGLGGIAYDLYILDGTDRDSPAALRFVASMPADVYFTERHFAVDGAGDVDGDGYDDVVFGVWSVGARILRGGPLGPMSTPFISVASAPYGYAVLGIGDVTRDGYDDVLLGSGACGSPIFGPPFMVVPGSSSGVGTPFELSTYHWCLVGSWSR